MVVAIRVVLRQLWLLLDFQDVRRTRGTHSTHTGVRSERVALLNKHTHRMDAWNGQVWPAGRDAAAPRGAAPGFRTCETQESCSRAS